MNDTIMKKKVFMQEVPTKYSEITWTILQDLFINIYQFLLMLT